MARIWDRVPALSANPGPFSLGFRFSATVPITVKGMWWYQTASGPASLPIKLYSSDGGTVHRTGTGSGMSAGWNYIPFGSTYALAAGTTLVAVAEADNEHRYDEPTVLPVTSADGVVTIPAAGARYDPGATFPTQAYAGLHGIDIEYEITPGARRRRQMTAYIRGTEGRLNTIMETLGTTKPSLWPFAEATGIVVSGVSVGDLIPSETAGAAEALEDDFSPLMLPCGLYSYHFHPTGDHHLAGIDHNNYSFGDGSVDSAFSVGAWIRPNAIATNVIIAKYDSAGNLEEWRFFIDSNGKLSLELHDASASATEIAVSDSALTIGQWVHVVAAYDGGETAPVVNLYVNAALVNDGSTTETGSYTAMENTAAPLTVGCSGVTALPVAEFHGRIALPFVTGKQLTAAEVLTLYKTTAQMVGIN